MATPGPAPSAALLDTSHRGAALTIDPQLGALVVGWHAATQRVRAVDLLQRRARWEGPPQLLLDPVARCIALAGGRAYVTHEQRLTALDLATGRAGWSVALPASVQTGLGRLCLADPYQGSSRGAVVLQLDDDSYLALDRNTGAPLWTLPDAKDYGPLPAHLGVSLGLQRGDRIPLWFIDPLRGPQPVCELPSAFALARHYGPRIVVGSGDIDGENTPGVAVLEMPTGRTLLRCAAPFDHRAGRPVLAGNLAFTMDLLQLRGSPNGPQHSTELVPGFHLARLESTGATLVCLFTEILGDGGLRLAGYDPATLRPRYYAEASLGRAVPLEEGRSNVACAGPWVLVVGLDPEAPEDPSLEARVLGARPALKLTALHGDTGALAWSTTVYGRFESLEPAGPYFVLRTADATRVYRPARPEPAAAYPFEAAAP